MIPNRKPSEAEHELLELIGVLVDGCASKHQLTRLNELLASDASARDTYFRYINLHVALRTYGDSQESIVLQASDVRALKANTIAPLRGGFRWRSLRTNVAAVAVACLLGLILFAWQRNQGVEQPSQSNSEHVPVVLAHVTKVFAARWAGRESLIVVGEQHSSELLDLPQGLLELTFKNGATLLLEAPSRIELVNEARAILHFGRVVAHVPELARGFTVNTPAGNIIDLGTEFGVAVNLAGQTQLQVFEGEVIAELNGGPSKSAMSRHLTAGQSLGVEIAGSEPSELGLNADRFVRKFPERSNGEIGGSLYNRSQFDVIHVLPAPAKVEIDANLKDWDLSGTFRSACLPPYDSSYSVEGGMMYDAQFLYVSAHVRDPAPMRSSVEDFPFQGGSVIVRLVTDKSTGWPLQARSTSFPVVSDPLSGKRPADRNENIVHLTMWYHRATEKARLNIARGMDFHGSAADPAQGWQGAFRRDTDGGGYTLEYAIAWSLLNSKNDPPHAGDQCAASWTVHWSDEGGRLCRGHLVEIVNPSIQPFHFGDGRTWGKAIYETAGKLPTGSVRPFQSK